MLNGQRESVHSVLEAVRNRNSALVVSGERVGRACSAGSPSPGRVPGGRAFLDRRVECEALDGLVEAVRAGASRALVVDGEPGVGKTALLEYLVRRAPGCQVVRVSGARSEMELVFAGLHQLCAPLLDRDERLPGPQRDALRAAFGLADGPAPDRFLVGLAVLGLLAEAARERALVCVVDDAQWLDSASAQTLAFVARRLVAESVALVFAVRSPGDVPELSGLPELKVEGLPQAEARKLLRSALPGRLDERVLDRIVAEARGNPLALLELPRGLTPAELAGGFGLPGGQALPRRIEESYRRQLAALPADTQRLVLVAAAEPVGEAVLVWRAAERLGIGVEAVAPAAEAGLLEIDTLVRFRHPLLRSAVYRAAPAEERRAVHQALSQVTDPDTDPDRRVWHAARAVAGPDEGVAAELERSAGRARARGGLAAAAAFLERAAELTRDPTRRAERALAAAQAGHQAGAPDSALRLLAVAEAGSLDKLQRARAELLRGQIAFAMRRGRDAPRLLLNAATQLGPLDARLARETYLEAIWAAWFAGRLAEGGVLRAAAEAAQAAPAAAGPARPADLLLDGLATRLTDGYAAALPMLRRALGAFRCSDLPWQEELGGLWLTSTIAGHVWDDETLEVLVTRHYRLVQLARDAGALTLLPLALNQYIVAHTCLGELASAASLADDLATVTEATGSPLLPYGALLLAAWRGHAAEAAELFETTTNEALRRGEGLGLSVVEWASAVLHNSLGRYPDALGSARQASEQPPVMGSAPWGALVELIEAASRTGNTDHAADALRRLTESTRASGTDWALGIEARCRALLSDGPAAESAYREAIERLGRTRVRGELARAHLLFGEWLRRENRRLDARAQLRTAQELFTAMGAEAFAERAARELGATGETARKRTVDTGGELTAQETQIARLVGEGLSNPEIGARLFLSPRTVEWHLSKIFTKLNITSRRQLRRVGGGSRSLATASTMSWK
jgi:DNA-binding CsgD family transcriptional regulator